MARRRRGRRIDGWVVIDKPLGVSSTSLVGKARWAWQAQKAGHAGTLDPLATGVLAIALGEATKTVPIAQDGEKTYRFTVGLGAATATDDLEGEVIARSDARPDDAAIEAALQAFRGDIVQVPPQFSAVKVDGQRAYDLARDGAEMDLKSRPLHVSRLELVERPDADHAVLEMTCGKGGYVRSIARDLGDALGCHGHVTVLRRLASGSFTLADAMQADDLDRVRVDGQGPLLPVSHPLSTLPRIDAAPVAAERLRMGRPLAIRPGEVAEGARAWVACAGEPVALVTIRDGTARPDRVILPPETPENPVSAP